MNIGITFANNYSTKVMALLSKLTAAGLSPRSALYIRRSPAAAAKSRLGRLLRRCTGRGGEEAGDRCLRQYLTESELPHWGRPAVKICRAEGIDLVVLKSLHAPETVAYVKGMELDVLINSGGGLFRREIIDAPRLGILNAHMGLLPAMRGMNVLEWSLLLGQPLGVTVHYISAGIDTGEILLFEQLRPQPGQTIEALRAKTAVMNIELLSEAVRGLADGAITPQAQRQEDGKQYFVMHQRLKEIAAAKLGGQAASCGRG